LLELLNLIDRKIVEVEKEKSDYEFLKKSLTLAKKT
jgi:hypothetical protein